MLFRSNRSLSAEEVGGLYANSSSKYVSADFTNLTEGVNNFTSYVQDVAGNVNSSSLSFDVDTIAPQVTIASPTATTYTSASVNFEIQTNENSTCNYSLDAGVTNYTLTANSTSTGFTVTRTLTNDANYVVNVYCADILGNQ